MTVVVHLVGEKYQRHAVEADEKNFRNSKD